MYSVLALVPRIFNHGEGVEHELAVEGLQAVPIVEVEGIDRGVFAGGLDESARAQSLAVGEVFLKGDAVPVVHLQGNESAVVIAMAKAGIVAHAGRGLTATAAGGGRAGRAAIQWPANDGGVHHAAGEIEPTIVEVAPQIPDALRGQVRLGNAFVVDDCSRATRETSAIASAG